MKKWLERESVGAPASTDEGQESEGLEIPNVRLKVKESAPRLADLSELIRPGMQQIFDRMNRSPEARIREGGDWCAACDGVCATWSILRQYFGKTIEEARAIIESGEDPRYMFTYVREAGKPIFEYNGETR